MPSEMPAPHVPPPAPCAPEEASAQQQASSSQPASKSSGEDTLFGIGRMDIFYNNLTDASVTAITVAVDICARRGSKGRDWRPRQEANLDALVKLLNEGIVEPPSRADTPPIPPRDNV